MAGATNTAYKAVKTVVSAIGKRIPVVLTAARATVASVRSYQFKRLQASTPVDPSVVVFDSFNGRGYSCSPRALYRAMVRDGAYAGTEKVWIFRRPVVRAFAERGYRVLGAHEVSDGRLATPVLEDVFSAEALEELRGATIVAWGTSEFRRAYARAGTWVTNSVLPNFLQPRPSQTYVQTWHGTPLKRLGCDINPEVSANAMYSAKNMHDRYRNEGARLTWLLSPSRYATEKFASAFDLVATGRTEVIVEEGYPRNDSLHTFGPEDVERARARFGIPEGKKVVLYAPTWRDNQHSSGVGYTYEAQADFDALRVALGDDYVILFRAHYFIASSFDFAAYDGFVVDVSRIDDINDLYIVSDMLVTDYSSVFFDYANLGRPIVFYMYDLEHYAGEIRGFYLDLAELPGPIVRTNAELIDAVRDAEHEFQVDAAKLAAFRARFTNLDDGHASERVLARVLPASRPADGPAS